MVKPITLYGHASGPNPWKVAIILEELNIPYDHKIMDMADLKKEPYEKINVNGRVPAIEDPNTGITLFESGAIIEYLAETYDTEGKLSFTKSPEKFYQSQWLHFQVILAYVAQFVFSITDITITDVWTRTILWTSCCKYIYSIPLTLESKYLADTLLPVVHQVPPGAHP